MSDSSSIGPLARPAASACPNPDLVTRLQGLLLGFADAEELALTFSMLSDPTRARVLHALSLTEELCGLDLITLLGVGQSALSHQLRLLRDNRIVIRRKAGRVAYYRLVDEHIRSVFTNLDQVQQRPSLSGRLAAGAGAPPGSGSPVPSAGAGDVVAG
jgi:ArsR family transcriptional regulator, lead/cadmium/zinc/bismuth-responsive transcriptional repressor